MDQTIALPLDGRIAWITGAGSGIGEAAAVALAGAGARVVLSGRTAAKLEHVAARIGPAASVEALDVTDSDAVAATAGRIRDRLGRIDILLANAGGNISARGWDGLTAEGVDTVLGANLSSAFYCALAVLPIMRAQQDGLLILTASIAGRFISTLPGPAYLAAKHGVVALGHTINMEEFVNGIRCTVLLPGEVATPIMEKRPVPVPPEELARMAQPEDIGDLVRTIACLPRRVVINEVMICPTHNRAYVAGLKQRT